MSAPSLDAVADGVADITPAWLSSVLGVEVDGVEAERVGAGQVGSTHQLTITYAPGATGPARLVAKLAADDPAVRQRVAVGYRREVGFYTQVADTVDVRAPRCWHGAISDDGTAFTLLLDDLSPARPGVQAAGCSPGDAAASVRNLAGLHAPRWDDESLASLAFLDLADEDSAALLGAVHVDATEQFVARYRDALDADDVATLRAAAAATGAWLLARPAPFALTHGDYRLDNLMFHPDGETVTALDWQTVTLGPPARDVAYFLGTSLDVPVRRDHEKELVGAYHAELVARRVTGYDADRCFDDYRLGQLQGPLITVLGSEFATAARTPDADRMFLAMATRSCTAIRDLRSHDLL
jgi:aminoglycoside/choline kinase family phosphotransferase